MPTFWYFLLLLLSTCNGERKSGCLLNDKNKMFWRTADAPGTNVSCSWRLAIAMGTGYRDQSRRRRGIFSFCPLDNHSKKPEENECPWTNEVFDAVGAEQKGYILSRNFNPPPQPFYTRCLRIEFENHECNPCHEVPGNLSQDFLWKTLESLFTVRIPGRI